MSDIQLNHILTFQDAGIDGSLSPEATASAGSLHSKRNPEEEAPGSKPAVLHDRDIHAWHQTNAPPDLVMISTPPPGKSMRSQDYVYDSTAGKGVTVYVIDTGMDTTNPVGYHYSCEAYQHSKMIGIRVNGGD